MERPMQKLNDLSRCLTALEPDGTLIAVIEMAYRAGSLPVSCLVSSASR
jgi:hypothetical protein